jgi:hypothetical protein
MYATPSRKMVGVRSTVPAFGPDAIPLETCDVQTELAGVLSEIGFLERA